MAFRDPADRAIIRLEVRRYESRCNGNIGLLQRADTLREVARLANVPIPYKIANELEARDAQRRLQLDAEERAKEIVTEQLARYVKADEDHRMGLRSKMAEDWGNLTGPLAHLRSWANSRLTVANQTLL